MLFLGEGAINTRTNNGGNIFGREKEWDKTTNRKTISPETVPCGSDQQEESVSTLGEDLADDALRRLPFLELPRGHWRSSIWRSPPSRFPSKI